MVTGIERPILFNTEMVRAILKDRKTETRRVVKPQPGGQLFRLPSGSCWPGCFAESHSSKIVRPPYCIGDTLYVRETWTALLGSYLYKAGLKPGVKNSGKWRPSIHMPRRAARIFLRVTDVRVEKLHQISDCTKEGVPRGGHATAHMNDYDERCFFRALWDKTIKPADRPLYGWEADPWVWVIEFERCEKPEKARVT